MRCHKMTLTVRIRSVLFGNRSMDDVRLFVLPEIMRQHPSSIYVMMDVSHPHQDSVGGTKQNMVHPSIPEIDDMVVDQMWWLRLSHLNGVLSVEIPQDKDVGLPRRPKRLVGSTPSDDGDLHPKLVPPGNHGKRERPAHKEV